MKRKSKKPTMARACGWEHPDRPGTFCDLEVAHKGMHRDRRGVSWPSVRVVLGPNGNPPTPKPSPRMTSEEFSRLQDSAQSPTAIALVEEARRARAEAKALRAALVAIADPVATITALAKAQGNRPNGDVLALLVRNGGWFMARARAALQEDAHGR